MDFRDTLTLYRLRRGEHTAFELVVKQNYERVYKQLWYLCSGNAEAAADLTQETFVEAWRSLPSFLGASSLKTWLHTIAVRTWHRHQRQQSKADYCTSSRERALERTADPADSPADQAEAILTAETLGKAVQALSPVSREVIILFYQNQLKYREIATTLNIPIGTVKSRLNAALKQLRAHLDPSGGDL